MANIDDLNNIHNKYKLALEKIDIDKTTLMDELGNETENIKTVKKVVRYSQLDNAFDNYAKVRDRIGVKDLDWIATLQAYINDVTEIAEKIAQEHAINTAKTIKGYNQAMQDIELDDEGTPFVSVPITSQVRKMGSNPPPSGSNYSPTVGFKKAIKPKPTPEPIVSTDGVPQPIEQPKEEVTTQPAIPVYVFRNYPLKERQQMIESIYMSVPLGMRTSNRMMIKWKETFPSISMTKTTIQSYCTRAGLKLEGQHHGGRKSKDSSQGNDEN